MTSARPGSRCPATRWAPRWVGGVGIALLLVIGARVTMAKTDLPAEHWYESFRQGQKTGSLHVRWRASTWEGKPSVRDTTVVLRAQYRRMIGLRDRFETRVVMDIERHEDGTLWWQRTRSEEAGRILIEELRWTGKGYKHTSTLEGRDQDVFIPSVAPAMTDGEAFLVAKVRQQKVKAGQSYPLPLVDVRGRRVRVHELVVDGRESITNPGSKAVMCWRVRQRDPSSKTVTTMWIDDAGSFVRIRDSSGSLIQRATEEQARRAPSRWAEFDITVDGQPSLPRVFSADRLWVDMHLSPDVHRELPRIPDSPWTRVLATQGDARTGWTLALELRSDKPGIDPPNEDVPKEDAPKDESMKSEAPGESAPRTVDDPAALERYLESTALMPVDSPLLKREAARILKGVQDPMAAAKRLVRVVYTSLDKRSPRVAQASATQILRDRCGDCSEHALLFVALCRTAGIPARRCSGYVCIGSVWGSHSWAEIYVGGWLSADPTTGELGAGARYVFFGYPDEPGSFPAETAQRIEGRVRFRATGIQEGAARYDLTDERRHHLSSPDGKSVINVLSGLEVRNLPKGWSATPSHAHRMTVRGPGIRADLYARADQGGNLSEISFYGRNNKRRTFAGVPAYIATSSHRLRIQLHSRRRLVQIVIRDGDEDDVATLERVLAACIQDPPLAWPDADASGATDIARRLERLKRLRVGSIDESNASNGSGNADTKRAPATKDDKPK